MSVFMDFEAEEKIWREGRVLIGVDEAGRGPLAGPVVAAAVALLPISVIPARFAKASARRAKAGIQHSSYSTGFPVGPALDYDRGLGMTGKDIIQSDLLKLGVADSKKISPKKREKIFEFLTNDERVSWAAGEASEREIDELNILQASLLAMKRATDSLLEKNKRLREKQFFVYVDGREIIPRLLIDQKAIIGGDDKVFSIAAASIIAKVTRDRLMGEYAKRYPQYQFEKHKGYGTKLHLGMIRAHGLSSIHRRSFRYKL